MPKRAKHQDRALGRSRRPPRPIGVAGIVTLALALSACPDDNPDDESMSTEAIADSTPAGTDGPVDDVPVETEAPADDEVDEAGEEEVEGDAGPSDPAELDDTPADEEPAPEDNPDDVVPTCGDPDAFSVEGYGSLSLPDGSCDQGDDPEGLYIGCTTALASCYLGGTPAFGVAGTPGTNHQEGVDDSLSTLEELFEYLLGPVPVGPEGVLIGASATCSGLDAAGTTVAQIGSATQVDLPLFSFGTCTDREFGITIDGTETRLPQVEDHVVDASEPDPAPFPGTYAVGQPDVRDQISDRFDPDDERTGIFHAANTINNTLSGSEGAPPGCLWFFEPRNVEAVVKVLDACNDQGNYWVFAAGLTEVEVDLTVHDTVVGTTSTYTNPLGVGSPAIADTQAFGTSGPLFDNSVFPCGFGQIAYTACSDAESPMNAGAFVTVSAVTADTIPLLGDGSKRVHVVDFSPSDGPTYSIEQNTDGWTVVSSTGSTRARALFRDNSVTLVVPVDELPEGPVSSQWSVDVDGAVVAQPPVPVVGIITTPVIEPQPADDTTDDAPPADEPAPEPTPPDSVPPPDVSESLPDFYAQLSASVAAGDLGFSLDRLDERVLQAYPDSCPAALESFADPDLVIEFVSEGPIEDWVYEANGQSFEVPGSQAVQIRLTGRGQSGDETTAHLSIVDGTYRWFTFC